MQIDNWVNHLLKKYHTAANIHEMQTRHQLQASTNSLGGACLPNKYIQRFELNYVNV